MSGIITDKNRLFKNRSTRSSASLGFEIRGTKEEVAAWEQRRNQISSKADWQFTTVDARIKLKRLYPSISS